MEQLPTKKLNIIDFAAANREAQELIHLFGLPIKPTAKVGRLSVAHQQMVEIMKAYRRNSQTIAFDEPTASLTDTEIDILFKLILQLKEQGKVILYVSHRLKELFELCNKIVVLKDGQFVKEVSVKDTNESDLICSMVGRDLGDIFRNLDRNDRFGEAVLEAKGLTNDYIHNVSFTLRRGQILGFAGLVGAGRTETMRAIFGSDPLHSGEVWIEGKKVQIKKPKDAIDMGIGLCPEDRKDEGLILHRSISDNITVPILKRVSRRGILNRKEEKRVASEAVKKYNIKTHSVDKSVIQLSGGNQQKVILGRWLSADTKILILDEPTKGIDVGSKTEIYQMVCNLAKKGIGIIFISSELSEVLNVCDSIIVMSHGRITGELPRAEVTEAGVLSLAMINQ